MADRDIGRGEGLTDPAGARPDRPTVQLLVENEGNRGAIRSMLDDHYTVETAQSVRDADLYLVERRVFPRHSDDLRAVVEREYPVFCPVVLVRRGGSRREITLPDANDREAPLLVDDVIEAPLNRALLIRRLDTLLVRREQAQKLQSQVSTLEERERELRSFKQAVEHSGHSITITETDGTIRYVNSAFEGTTGYSAEEAIGENPRILKSGEHGQEFYADLWGTILGGEVWEGEVINERKNGDRYVVEQTIAPILDGGDIEGFVSVNSEVTDRIRHERALKRHRQELELLRQILTRVLRHNIRNDLNVVLGHAQRLEEEHGDIEGVSKIIENAVGIAETSETARELAALIERSEPPSKQDIATVAELVVEGARERFPDTTFVLDAPEECVAYASSELQRAVTELVENAAEHNSSGDPQVRVTVEQRETARLVVEDNGQGIPENELVPLRRDEETALEHGSSVSLWLVSWIVDQSGGSIRFDSDESGTRIELELPREKVSRSDLSPLDGRD